MISENIVATYEEIIQKRFPSVHVISDTRFADEYGDSFAALGVPDERRAEFADFILDELGVELMKRGIEFMGIMPYSPAEAEEIFPQCKPVAAADA